MNNFKDMVTKHLENYKINKLRVAETGIFRYRGKEIPCGHILPENMGDLNIIYPYNLELNSSQSLNFKRHKYFHHLNSSQAMCINFFFPLIKAKQLEYVLKILNISGRVDYSSVAFEKESNVEAPSDRKTSFDFYFQTLEGSNIFFEIKYTENGFGKAIHDQEHIDKFNRTYEPAMKKCSAIKDEYKTMDQFLEHYQIMRNLVNIKKKNYVVFIYPEENLNIKRDAENVNANIISKNWQKHFIPLTWETLVADPNSYLSSIQLKQYYENEFSKKYLGYKQQSKKPMLYRATVLQIPEA